MEWDPTGYVAARARSTHEEDTRAQHRVLPFLRVSGFGGRVTLFWLIPPLPKPAAHSDQDAGTIQLDPNPGIEVPIATAIGTFMIECTEMVELGGTEGSVAPGSSGCLSRISRRWARPDQGRGHQPQDS